MRAGYKRLFSILETIYKLEQLSRIQIGNYNCGVRIEAIEHTYAKLSKDQKIIQGYFLLYVVSIYMSYIGFTN